MIYGYFDQSTKTFKKWTRISSNVVILNKNKLSMADHVWVWHHSIIDATEGVTIEEGCQIGAWVGIFTHGSEHAIRLLGQRFVNIPNKNRIGYTRGSVQLGAYTFVGAGSIILPGVKIGKGCIISAHSIVNKDVPDYSIIGTTGISRMKTTDIDRRFHRKFDLSETYYDPILEELFRNK